MNENIIERFGRSRRAFKQPQEQAEVWILPQQLNANVRQYFEDSGKPVEGGSWLRRPEIPSSAEILDIEAEGSTSSGDVEVQVNRLKGPWDSKEEYLGTHYELLREDAIRPLREAVSKVRMMPTATEETFDGSIGIYEKVHICAVTCSTRGIAIRATFSLGRVGKKILWEQSKRLITGGLVVLTPMHDMFKSTAIVATVAARPIEGGLDRNPPEIDLYIARAGEQEIDPAKEFVLIEDRGGLYEADRHTLLALQRMIREPFPLNEHLVEVQSKVSAPDYVKEKPKTDMTGVLNNNRHETYENVDILQGWPVHPQTQLDASQLAALRRILTKRLAIVQGPPGTGKTYISVQAIRIMLANRKSSDPPIIIACQTNHAIDQILKQIAEFEPDFVRLGGRSKDRGVIKARTLYEVRNQTKENPLAGSLTPSARKKMRELTKELELLLMPLKPGKLPLDHDILKNFKLLSERQAESLAEGAAQWVQDQLTNPNDARSPFTVWLGRKLISVPPKQLPEEFGFDYEEADLAFESLKEIEAETFAKDDEKFENLSGESLRIADNFTCRKVDGIIEAKIMEALREQDMWKIPETVRPAVYRYLQAKLKKVILTTFREKTKLFNEWAVKRRIGFFEGDEPILKKQKVIGMTTTGFSKYRGLIAALEPKIILIEEAAETLEAPVTVACVPSLQHLILVGDHKQLRPHCHVSAHQDKPFFLNVSLFERLVKNNVEFDTLAKQRRMIPEVRRILYPIYKDLIKDHDSLLNPINRPPIPGMGGVNSFFFTHQWPEQRDDQMSAYNPEEADMIIGFVEYLIYNGMQPKEITILTFYNGQRKKLLYGIRHNALLGNDLGKFKIVTVDSYQGEENKVVLLSLVRSNNKGQIGFLNIDNRVCVALSRAQCGFYIFGNGMLLYNNPTWEEVIKIMANQGPKADRLRVEPRSRVEEHLPIRCSNHNNLTKIKDASDWEKTNGGCAAVKCDDKLPCGHPCPLLCHPIPHDMVICRSHCGKPLTCCSLKCEGECGKPCVCKVHSKARAPAQIANVPHEGFDGRETMSQQSSSESWNSFAGDEAKRYAIAASAPASRRTSPEKENKAALLDLAPADEMKQLSLGLDGAGSRPQSASPAVSDGEKVKADGKRKKWTEKIVSGAEMGGGESLEDWSKKGSLLD
ncbi:hypothetical protein LTR37_004048 [Vermiconidia calcicola]|uniref:Uncharacterized protein n=1 Tax=Vermiconidia calcicola TaxID=1690605 RepID=A0ACC3NNC8_9PEZI|nr:hypothetical protein LTR37_004048 [Vermiconidia calcicola]